MEFILRLEHQEDENAPRGTRYYASFINPTTKQVMVETESYSFLEATDKAVKKLMEVI
jgi:hypothetical protein